MWVGILVSQNVCLHDIVLISKSFGTRQSGLLSSECSTSELLPLVDTELGSPTDYASDSWRGCSVSVDSVTLSSCSAHRDSVHVCSPLWHIIPASGSFPFACSLCTHISNQACQIVLHLSRGTYSRLLLTSNLIKMIVVGRKGRLCVIPSVTILTGYGCRGSDYQVTCDTHTHPKNTDRPYRV